MISLDPSLLCDSEDGYKAELAMLREFYAAATAPNVMLVIEHAPGCDGWRNDRPCNCGREAKLGARIDNALAALAEASEDAS